MLPPFSRPSMLRTEVPSHGLGPERGAATLAEGAKLNSLQGNGVLCTVRGWRSVRGGGGFGTCAGLGTDHSVCTTPTSKLVVRIKMLQSGSLHRPYCSGRYPNRFCPKSAYRGRDGLDTPTRWRRIRVS